MSLWIALATLFISNAQAQITIDGVNTARFSRATSPLFGDIDETITTVYGGVTNNSGGACASGALSTSTCNSCEGASSATACNRTAIHDDLLFEVIITNDGSASGEVIVTTDDLANDQELIYESNFLLGAGQTTISFTWREICENLFGMSGGCTDALPDDTSRRIRIGIDEDNDGDLEASTSDVYSTDITFILADIGTTGAGTLCTSSSTSVTTPICNFIAYPGDSKVFIENIRASCDFPNSPNGGDADIRLVRIFYEKGTATEGPSSFPDISSDNVIDLEIGDTSGTCSETQVIGLSDNQVTGLTNDIFYGFSVGVVDEANNVGYVVTPSLTDADDTNGCYDAEADNWVQNCHVTAPSEVLGLIEDEFDCFITTATYGSPFRPKVEDFRKFRNQFLKTHTFGNFLIETYYKFSPPVAKWIRENPSIKPWVRVLLYPFWLFAWTALHHIWLLFALSFIGCMWLLKKLHWRRI